MNLSVQDILNLSAILCGGIMLARLVWLLLDGRWFR